MALVVRGIDKAGNQAVSDGTDWLQHRQILDHHRVSGMKVEGVLPTAGGAGQESTAQPNRFLEY